jgi:hypothetical protein
MFFFVFFFFQGFEGYVGFLLLRTAHTGVVPEWQVRDFSCQ